MRPAMRACVVRMGRVLLRQFSFSRQHVRPGIQVFAAVLLIMATFSTPAVYDTFSLSLTANPQLIVVYGCILLLARNMALKPTSTLAAQICLSALLGAALAEAVLYLTLAANGGSWSNTATKAVVSLVLSTPLAFLLTVLRFRSPALRFPMMFTTLVLGLSVCGNYRTSGPLWKFPLSLAMYVAFAGLCAVLSSQFVTPTPSGMLARRHLASALRSAGGIAWTALDTISGEVTSNGRLAQSSGEQQGGLDTGLHPIVWPLHQKASAAGTACTAAMTHTIAARSEIDVYRPTHVLPYVPFFQLSVLARSLLSATTMLVYSVQTGTLDAAICHRYREEQLQVAAAFQSACGALADSLESNRPAGEAFQALGQLHDSFLRLGEAASGLPPELHMEPSTLAFTTVLSTLFSAISRLRKLYRVLPAALARDQPGAEAEACFEGMPDWDLALLAQLESQAEGRDPLAVLRQSLISGPNSRLGTPAQSPRFGGRGWVGRESTSLEEALQQAAPLEDEHKKQLLDRLSKRAVTTAADLAPQTEQQQQQREEEGKQAAGPFRRAWRWLAAPVGGAATWRKLRIALQLCVCYLAVMALEIGGAAYVALETRPVWAMTIVIVLVESSAGSSIRKSLLRIAGTLAGLAAGFAILYFVVLCNGLSHANHPQKFILTSLLLAVACGISGAAAARTPSHTYMQITFCITVAGVALVGYTGEAVLWSLGLWRGAMTGIGVGIHFLSVTLIFPVTGRDILRDQFAAALGQLAAASEATVSEITGGEQKPGAEGQAEGKEGKPAKQARREAGAAGEAGTQQHGDGAAREQPEAAQESAEVEMQQAGQGEEQHQGQQQNGQAGQQQQWRLAAFRQAEGREGQAAGSAREKQGDGGGQQDEQQQVFRYDTTPSSAATASSSSRSRRLEEAEGQQAATPDGLAAAAAAAEPPAADESHRAAQLAAASPFAGPNSQAAEPAAPEAPAHHVSARRLPLGQQPSLVVEPPAPATLSGSSRKAITRAVWQLRAPIGPELLAESEHLLGEVYARLFFRTWQANSTISSMALLIPTLRFEYTPFKRPHRLPGDAAFRAQRLCRHCLNVLSAFATSMDAHHLRHVELLARYRSQVERVSCQLGECLRSLQAMVQGRMAPQGVVPGVASLQTHTERLFLLVLLQDLPKAGGSAQAAQTVAFLAMLFSLGWALRQLALALARTFWGPDSAEVSALANELEDDASWQVDEQLLAAAQAVVGLAGS